MKYLIKQNFYNKYKNKEISDEIIIDFLKENDEHDEDFEDFLIEEIKNYIKSKDERQKREVVKEEKEKINKATKDSYFLYKIEDNKELQQKIKSVVKIKTENIEKIKDLFDTTQTNYFNYSRINPKELFDFSPIQCISSFKNGKYRVFAKENMNITYMSICDIIGCIFDLTTFKQQLLKLNELLGWDVFIDEFKTDIIVKNKNNLDYLNSIKDKTLLKRIKSYKSSLKQLIVFENNVINELNRTKNGEHYIFLSKSSLAKIMQISNTKAFTALTLLTFLKFIDRVDYSDIPLEDQMRLNKTNKWNNVNLFKINNFSENENFILENLKKLEENEISTKKITFNNISNILGIEEAKRVFKKQKKGK